MTLPVPHVYREKTLHLSAIGWMKGNWDYQELYSDEEATGARMDSIGILNGDPIAIEVKPQIVAGMAFHRAGKSGSIESKIAETLRKLYKGDSGKQIDILRSRWNSKPLCIGILTGQLSSTGKVELEEMLASRSEDWCFSYKIFVWNGDAVRVLNQSEKIATEGTDLADIDIPTLLGTAKRNPPLSRDSWAKLAEANGLLEMFETFPEIARRLGFSMRRDGSRIAFSKRGVLNGRTVVTIFDKHVDPERGFVVGVNAGEIGLDASLLPHKIAPRLGYLNTNIYVREPEEFASLLGLIIRSRP